MDRSTNHSLIAAPAAASCRHCGRSIADKTDFCCPGCKAAFTLIGSLGLDAYYAKRRLATGETGPQPEDTEMRVDLSAWIRPAKNDRLSLAFLVDGITCGACVWLIEQSLLKQAGVETARVSLSTHRLSVTWFAGVAEPGALVALVQKLGYRLLPCDPARLAGVEAEKSKALLRALAVAGFAAANVMLLSVSVWSGHAGDMDAPTRDLLHWISALIALPAIAYAGRPFFRSALGALKAGRTNMDVPISLAVILAPTMSLIETFRSGSHAYFDSAVTLLFFLLIGRFLDFSTRNRARALGRQLLALNAVAATIVEPNGVRRELPPASLAPGMMALVGAGQRIPADGVIVEGASALDTSLVTGESLPSPVKPGDAVQAGTLNVGQPITMRILAVGDSTLLAEIVRLMEAAETRRGRYVRLADRVARYYSPVVHTAALLTFLGWITLGGIGWQSALMNAISVLIITCPCALALAVPVTQVAASQRLMKAGILLKSGDALERLRNIDHIVFDKTGTLTLGRLALAGVSDPKLLPLAAGIAGASRHPLSRSLARAVSAAPVLSPIEEIPGQGLVWHGPDGDWRLGSAAFTGQKESPSLNPILCLSGPAGETATFTFSDQIRPDAAATMQLLKSQGFGLEICSGDRVAPVAALAKELGIAEFHARLGPAAKVERLQSLAGRGCRVFMIGDGINDAAALAAASVSMAPASGADISQSACDIVFQGESLAAVPLTLEVARFANRIMRQNLALALTYNLAAIPLAVLGFVTPLVAAIAMSSSSLIVILNSLRLARLRPAWGLPFLARSRAA